MVHGDGTWRTLGISFAVQFATSSAVVAALHDSYAEGPDRLALFWVASTAVVFLGWAARRVLRMIQER